MPYICTRHLTHFGVQVLVKAKYIYPCNWKCVHLKILNDCILIFKLNATREFEIILAFYFPHKKASSFLQIADHHFLQIFWLLLRCFYKRTFKGKALYLWSNVLTYSNEVKRTSLITFCKFARIFARVLATAVQWNLFIQWPSKITLIFVHLSAGRAVTALYFTWTKFIGHERTLNRKALDGFLFFQFSS